jgi:hypothetical protein
MVHLSLVTVAVLVVSCLALLPSVTADIEPHILSFIKVANIKQANPNSADDVKINVWPTLVRNGEFVQASFSTTSPKKDDWIGLYAPPDTDVQQTSPIKYQFASNSSDYLRTGSGTLR